MNEKTFKELIKKHQYFTTAGTAVTKENAIKLMQQVREATIAECVEILTDPNIPKSRMAALKTDRIKVTYKN